MLAPMATDPKPATPAPGKPAVRRGGVGVFFLRLLFGGRRAIVTLPVVLVGGYLGARLLDYEWYRGVSEGTRTGVVTKVSRKGTPLCKYESVEMLVGLQPGAAAMGSETWEFTVDAEHADLIARLQDAEKDRRPVTIQYRQDTTDLNAKPAPPKNLPWRWCVATSYHATDIVK